MLLDAEDYDAILETLAILSDSKLVDEIGKGIEELERGDAYTLDKVRADVGRLARPTGDG